MCALCSESGVEYDEEKMKYKAVGEPTEAALQVLVEKLGLPVSAGVVGKDGGSDPQDSHALAVMRKTPSSRCCIASRFWKDKYDVLATLEFNRTRKSMSVICAPKVGLWASGEAQGVSGRNVMFVKGAPENVLARCTSVCAEVGMAVRGDEKNGTILPLTAELRKHYEGLVAGMSGKALRCLAVAGKLDLGEFSDYTGTKHSSHK